MVCILVGFVQYIPQYLVSCFSSIVSEPAEEQKGSYLIPAWNLLKSNFFELKTGNSPLFSTRKKYNRLFFPKRIFRTFHRKGREHHILLYTHLLVQQGCSECLQCIYITLWFFFKSWANDFFTLVFSKHLQDFPKSKNYRLISPKNEFDRINKSELVLIYLFSFIAHDNYSITPVPQAKAMWYFSYVILTLP